MKGIQILRTSARPAAGAGAPGRGEGKEKKEEPRRLVVVRKSDVEKKGEEEEGKRPVILRTTGIIQRQSVSAPREEEVKREEPKVEGRRQGDLAVKKEEVKKEDAKREQRRNAGRLTVNRNSQEKAKEEVKEEPRKEEPKKVEAKKDQRRNAGKQTANRNARVEKEEPKKEEPKKEEPKKDDAKKDEKQNPGKLIVNRSSHKEEEPVKPAEPVEAVEEEEEKPKPRRRFAGVQAIEKPKEEAKKEEPVVSPSGLSLAAKPFVMRKEPKNLKKEVCFDYVLRGCDGSCGKDHQFTVDRIHAVHGPDCTVEYIRMNKIPVCLSHLTGRCRLGPNCKYVHKIVGMRPAKQEEDGEGKDEMVDEEETEMDMLDEDTKPMDPRGMILCMQFYMGRCSSYNCPFAHEILPNMDSDLWAKRPCVDCAVGKCNNRHCTLNHNCTQDEFERVRRAYQEYQTWQQREEVQDRIFSEEDMRFTTETVRNARYWHPRTPIELSMLYGPMSIECTFYKQGNCTRGESCKFLHVDGPLTPERRAEMLMAKYQKNHPLSFFHSYAPPAHPEVFYDPDGDLDQSNQCRVCFSNPIEISFDPCGHALCCRACAGKLKECPFCRGRILDFHEVKLPF